MRYFVTLEGRTFAIDIDGGNASVDGEAASAELAAIAGTTLRHLLLDGRSHLLASRPTGEKGVWDLHMDGERYRIDVVDERTRAIRAMTARADGPVGPRPIRAPMPGLVVRLEVAPGDRVAAGQGVLIIEAMKMENELKAEALGVVSRILVEPGQPVEKGATLVEFVTAPDAVMEAGSDA